MLFDICDNSYWTWKLFSLRLSVKIFFYIVKLDPTALKVNNPFNFKTYFTEMNSKENGKVGFGYCEYIDCPCKTASLDYTRTSTNKVWAVDNHWDVISNLKSKSKISLHWFSDTWERITCFRLSRHFSICFEIQNRFVIYRDKCKLTKHCKKIWTMLEHGSGCEMSVILAWRIKRYGLHLL